MPLVTLNAIRTRITEIKKAEEILLNEGYTPQDFVELGQEYNKNLNIYANKGILPDGFISFLHYTRNQLELLRQLIKHGHGQILDANTNQPVQIIRGAPQLEVSPITTTAPARLSPIASARTAQTNDFIPQDQQIRLTNYSDQNEMNPFTNLIKKPLLKYGLIAVAIFVVYKFLTKSGTSKRLK
jgi:hypothetical protein